ncbi:hypothetical protein BC826DRAFT_626979 [Russula brevipes]|nr:hypothetical protein BC826DRAFT_626979 [Russula brevipes]
MIFAYVLESLLIWPSVPFTHRSPRIPGRFSSFRARLGHMTVPTSVHALTGAIHEGPWWRHRGVLLLNFYLLLPLLTGCINGYDTYLINGRNCHTMVHWMSSACLHATSPQDCRFSLRGNSSSIIQVAGH